ncbi:MAG: leucine--tRNA ligase [Bacteroidota bacterium]
MPNYDYTSTEKKWQQYWKENGSFIAEKDSTKPKFYVLDMFPYPSGAGLHVGHPLGYIATDVIARYKRVKGFNVLHPMGFDSFGLPAEQYAIKTGIHPSETTKINTKRYQEQMEMLGLYHDPEAVLRTSDPAYYHWTQWIFIRLFEHWYDKQHEKARPIQNLVEVFEVEGNASILAATDQKEVFTSEQWNGYSPAEKNEILMNYRLAYNAYATVNWCPALGTVLANDEVKDGRSERGNYPVERRQMRQWMLRITAYADRLLSGLEGLDWTDSMKAMQTNWIGRSEGASIRYEVAGHPGEEIEVFTTRPDTLFGNTFMVLAPEHPLVEKIATNSQKKDLDAYIEWATNRSERDRIADTDKTGVWTGAYALHPITNEKLPIWISDYVIITYGTGAIMAVPAHDQRDWEFAHKFELPIKEVISGGNISEEAYSSKDGIMVNSGELDGLKASEAIGKIIQALESKGIGKGEVTYRQRDVIWSRQRYWGEPTPIVYKDDVASAIPDSGLPLELPHLEVYKPSETGEPPLARAGDSFRFTEDGSERDLNTMPGAAGSSWYFFRYFDTQNDTAFADPERIKYWMPVDMYVGGTEHAVGHLLFARFWTKFLYDLGYSSVDEPFNKLVNQGMIQGISAFVTRLPKNSAQVFVKDEAGVWEGIQLDEKERQIAVSQELLKDYPGSDPQHNTDIHLPIEYVKNHGGEGASYLDEASMKKLIGWEKEIADVVFVCAGGYYLGGVFHSFENGKSDQFQLRSEVEKMSKSKYNVVNPDDIIRDYGTDTFRLFEMFLGPLEDSKVWNTQQINGVARFIRKTYDLFIGRDGEPLVTEDQPTPEELKALHIAIRQTEEGIERLAFNTCIPAFMTLTNTLSKMNCSKRAILEPFLVIMSPFAPHLAEELWQRLGHTTSILEAAFPQWEKKYLAEDEIKYPVQINGKVRAQLMVSSEASKDEVEAAALADERVQQFLDGKTPRKVIVVPGRIVNLVV